MPPAPPTFSITICWPRISAARAASVRPSTSTAPPAANGTTMVIGRLGKSCADAGTANGGSESQARAARMRTMSGLRRDPRTVPGLSGSASTEQALNVGELQLHIGRAAMIALAGVRRRLHLAKQGVHLLGLQ